ncbi:MAG: phosphatidate cytidylyltransferase [Candidatus Omnitrophica bacterium]|nr:phosphatidate cytidylyltransferase [Candidatus Omnitrophota bacterium]
MLKNLLGRLASSVILISLVGLTLFAFPLWMFAVVLILFVAAGLYEFFTMVRHRGILVHRLLSVVLGVVFTGLVAWRCLVEPGLVPTPVVGPGATAISWMWDIFWPATIVIIFIRQFTRENTFEALGGVATTLFGLAYVAALFSYLLYIRTVDLDQGAWLVLYLIFVTKMGDAGAYVVGNIIGRHTLIARISPRKTVEGFAGAVVVSGLAALVAQPMLGRPVHPFLSLLLGLFLGVCGQLGDLAESLLKRDCQVKDTSSLMPGLGGVLDVIDSLLFTAPLFYGILIYG